ncbi:hypothetical protein SAMN05518682_0698 [Cellulosimicrobium aquatile]|jgi:hypothetical protein|uniref:Uncharacterized protein n=1 Tax=Cellulosimicrobium aquatile TaxID=1612203 RepID=A0A1N6NSE8_9MICO|nr:hypothetical protein SAMN05518682_0698 [Cellulosimicrobium aquatile]
MRVPRLMFWATLVLVVAGLAVTFVLAAVHR